MMSCHSELVVKRPVEGEKSLHLRHRNIPLAHFRPDLWGGAAQIPVGIVASCFESTSKPAEDHLGGWSPFACLASLFPRGSG